MTLGIIAAMSEELEILLKDMQLDSKDIILLQLLLYLPYSLLLHMVIFIKE